MAESKPRIITAIGNGVKYYNVAYNSYSIEFMKYFTSRMPNVIFAVGKNVTEREEEVCRRLMFLTGLTILQVQQMLIYA